MWWHWGEKKIDRAQHLRRPEYSIKRSLNPLNAELNPTCHLLALLGAHHIFHVGGLRVKLVVKFRTEEERNIGSETLRIRCQRLCNHHLH